MKKFPIIFIFIFALFLRVYELGQVPVGFLWDEAALGYNAYSILKTGRDEYGKFFPIIFKSFGDYKPGLYVYLTVPSVAIFGLNELSTRLPSALLGALSVLVLSLMIKESLKLDSENDKKESSLPAVAALLLAISPWHLSFSRGAWELNVMTFEILAGFLFLLKFINTKRNLFVRLSLLLFLLTLITYQSSKFLTPMLLVGFTFFFRERLKKLPTRIKFGFISIFLLCFLILNLATFASGRAGRIKVMSLFSYPRSSQEAEAILVQDKNSQTLFNLFHSSPTFFIRSIAGRYFNHFSEKFLIDVGDWSNPRNGIVYQGLIYFIDYLFLGLGMAFLFGKKKTALENFIIFWLVVAPIASALTRDSISSVRSFPEVVPLVIIIGNGICFLIDYMKGKKVIIRRFIFIGVIGLYVICFARMLDLYFIHDPKINSQDRLYGYKEMINYILPLMNNKKQATITLKYGQPYIFYLFYSLYDPVKYQKQAKLTEDPDGDVGMVEKIDNIEFRKIYWPDDRAEANSLFVGDEFDLPLTDIIGQENIQFIKEIKFLNNKTAFRVVETK